MSDEDKKEHEQLLKKFDELDRKGTGTRKLADVYVGGPVAFPDDKDSPEKPSDES